MELYSILPVSFKKAVILSSDWLVNVGPVGVEGKLIIVDNLNLDEFPRLNFSTAALVGKSKSMMARLPTQTLKDLNYVKLCHGKDGLFDVQYSSGYYPIAGPFKIPQKSATNASKLAAELKKPLEKRNYSLRAVIRTPDCEESRLFQPPRFMRDALSVSYKDQRGELVSGSNKMTEISTAGYYKNFDAIAAGVYHWLILQEGLLVVFLVPTSNILPVVLENFNSNLCKVLPSDGFPLIPAELRGKIIPVLVKSGMGLGIPGGWGVADLALQDCLMYSGEDLMTMGIPACISVQSDLHATLQGLNWSSYLDDVIYKSVPKMAEDILYASMFWSRSLDDSISRFLLWSSSTYAKQNPQKEWIQLIYAMIASQRTLYDIGIVLHPCGALVNANDLDLFKSRPGFLDRTVILRSVKSGQKWRASFDALPGDPDFIGSETRPKSRQKSYKVKPGDSLPESITPPERFEQFPETTTLLTREEREAKVWPTVKPTSVYKDTPAGISKKSLYSITDWINMVSKTSSVELADGGPNNSAVAVAKTSLNVGEFVGEMCGVLSAEHDFVARYGDPSPPGKIYYLRSVHREGQFGTFEFSHDVYLDCNIFGGINQSILTSDTPNLKLEPVTVGNSIRLAIIAVVRIEPAQILFLPKGVNSDLHPQRMVSSPNKSPAKVKHEQKPKVAKTPSPEKSDLSWSELPGPLSSVKSEGSTPQPARRRLFTSTTETPSPRISPRSPSPRISPRSREPIDLTSNEYSVDTTTIGAPLFRVTSRQFEVVNANPATPVKITATRGMQFTFNIKDGSHVHVDATKATHPREVTSASPTDTVLVRSHDKPDNLSQRFDQKREGRHQTDTRQQYLDWNKGKKIQAGLDPNDSKTKYKCFDDACSNEPEMNSSKWWRHIDTRHSRPAYPCTYPNCFQDFAVPRELRRHLDWHKRNDAITGRPATTASSTPTRGTASAFMSSRSPTPGSNGFVPVGRSTPDPNAVTGAAQSRPATSPLDPQPGPSRLTAQQTPATPAEHRDDSPDQLATTSTPAGQNRKNPPLKRKRKGGNN